MNSDGGTTYTMPDAGEPMPDAPMDALALFWRDVTAAGAACDVLDRAAEAALMRRARLGDAAAREALVLHNVRLARHFAHRYARRFELPLEDALQEGMIGLMHAATKCDERRGTTFATYAGWWLRQAMDRASEDQRAGRLRLPSWALTLSRKHARLHGERLPFDRAVVSMDTPLSEWSDNDVPDTLYDVVAAEPEPALADSDSHMDLPGALLASLAAYLEPRQALVIALRFGLSGESDEGESLRAVGDRLGLSRERVRQIQVTALGILRAHVPDLWPEHAGRVVVRRPARRYIVTPRVVRVPGRKAG